MSNRIDELDAIVRQFDLNEHPFYVEWRAGTLPIERLAEYAAEWAPFISAIDQGWDRIGYPDYAAEEREHDELWTRFRAALGVVSRTAATVENSKPKLSCSTNATRSPGVRRSSTT